MHWNLETLPFRILSSRVCKANLFFTTEEDWWPNYSQNIVWKTSFPVYRSLLQEEVGRGMLIMATWAPCGSQSSTLFHPITKYIDRRESVLQIASTHASRFAPDLQILAPQNCSTKNTLDPVINRQSSNFLVSFGKAGKTITGLWCCFDIFLCIYLFYT